MCFKAMGSFMGAKVFAGSGLWLVKGIYKLCLAKAGEPIRPASQLALKVGAYKFCWATAQQGACLYGKDKGGKQSSFSL